MNHAAGAAVDASSHLPVPGFFSLRRANRALVYVRRVVSDIVTEYARLLELQEILELHQRNGDVDDLERVKAASGEVVARLQGYLCELDGVGVKFRDFARGLVDFPARVGGREILYCWQLGEPSVQYWHHPGEGLAGRRPICELAGLRRAVSTTPA
ncbi:MAG: DUF2203 family protein [Planctomycetota bacterium]|jgi:hypothetical protein